MMDPTRLGVGVIGAGKIGPVLASALAGAGHTIVGITHPSDDSERVEAMLPGVPFLSPQQICERSELVVLALPDSELPGFVEGFSAANGWMSGQIVAHTSIVHGLEVLQPAVAQGVIPIGLYPLMEFSGWSMDLTKMVGAWCVVSAPPVASPIAHALAVEMGLEPLVVAEEHRSHVASAVALATSFFHTTIEEAASRLRLAGVANPGVVLSALVGSSIDNALRKVSGNDLERGTQ
jgi:predicted short-subunit dehydrogenase-like oxidoreductase (DUF2520 family)